MDDTWKIDKYISPAIYLTYLYPSYTYQSPICPNTYSHLCTSIYICILIFTSWVLQDQPRWPCTDSQNSNVTFTAFFWVPYVLTLIGGCTQVCKVCSFIHSLTHLFNKYVLSTSADQVLFQKQQQTTVEAVVTSPSQYLNFNIWPWKWVPSINFIY